MSKGNGRAGLVRGFGGSGWGRGVVCFGGGGGGGAGVGCFGCGRRRVGYNVSRSSVSESDVLIIERFFLLSVTCVVEDSSSWFDRVKTRRIPLPCWFACP